MQQRENEVPKEDAGRGSRPQWCWQEEYKRWLDDCGSMGCKLTGATWNEWNHEDFCQECPHVIWDAEEWREVVEGEE